MKIFSQTSRKYFSKTLDKNKIKCYNKLTETERRKKSK
nr:MAG TPA: hypothetical protein [Caudoviricetes sp.]